MSDNVNMHYRFTSDSEPTDEQLLALMKEIRADVRRESENLKTIVAENIRREYASVRAMFPDL
jgi:hypothetical protein